MNALLNSDDIHPSVTMERLLARHGAWRVLRSFLALALRKRPRVVPVHHLSPHIRRDIGLSDIARPDWHRHLR